MGKDGIRAMDLVFVVILGGLLIYYYGRRGVLWTMNIGWLDFGLEFIVWIRAKKNDMPCVHAPFCFSGNSRLWWTNNYTHS